MIEQLRIGTTTAFLLALLFVNSASARSVAKQTRTPLSKALADEDDGPAFDLGVHDVGRLRLTTSNRGQIAFGAEHPKYTRVRHLYEIGLWVGAVSGRDSLVSTGTDCVGLWQYEFAPDYPPGGNIGYRSILDPESPQYEGAHSEQDFIAVYYDTLDSLHNTTNRGLEYSRPIGVEVTQESYAWSYGYAEDFVLFDLKIKNMDYRPLKDVYIGLCVDADVGFGGGASGDICGILRTFPSHRGCAFDDTLNLAWLADADGDPYEYVGPRRWVAPREYLLLPGNPPQIGPFRSHFSVAATKVLRTPGFDWDFSYNWWVHGYGEDWDDTFGPQQLENYRVFVNGQIGAPETDNEKYFLMANEEFDYDQPYTARVSAVNPKWAVPDPDIAEVIAQGGDTRYLLSWGPFQLGAYASLPLTFAYVIGEEFHSDLYNTDNLPDNPWKYYDNVDFSDLALNATWARWIYDNPGFDTDDDGYRGDFRICGVESTLADSGWLLTEADTFWYRGDGVPDFRGASPPPAPDFWVTSRVNGLHVRFNGQRSETEKDIFSGITDFEGYHVYIGRDNRRASFSLVAGYDRENYDRYIWDADHLNPDGYPDPGFILKDIPFTLQELRCLYGEGSDPCLDTSFHPLDYIPGHPLSPPQFDDSVFYFEPHDYNTSQSGGDMPIRKRFPDAPDPRGIPIDQLTDDFYTDDGYLKFFEYEYTIAGLLSTVPYFVSVTAFDFGSPTGGVEALETVITDVMIEAYPFNSEGEATGADNNAYVYPNPYIASAGYRADGFELRTRTDLPNYRVHTIHFTNLPPKCTIRIHTPDGDLVREIRHDQDPSSGLARDHDWHLVTQNHQLVVSGWYYWTVESPDGRVQIGKLAILM